MLRPDNNKGDTEKGYYPVPRFDPDSPPVKHYGDNWKAFWYDNTGANLRKLGFSEAEIEERFNKYIKGLRGLRIK